MKETVLYFLFGKFAGRIRKPSTLIKTIGCFWHDLHAGTLSKTYCLMSSLLILLVPDFSLVLLALNLGSTGSYLGQMTEYAC